MATGLTTNEAIQAATDRLAQLRPVVGGQALVAALPKPEVLPPTTTVVLEAVAQGQQEMSQQTLVNAGRNFNVDAQQLKVAQQQRGQNEYVARNRAQFENNTLNPNSPANTVNNDGNLRFNGKMMVPESVAAPSAGDVREGLVKAVWIGDKLLLARRVSVGGSEYVQGAWLDWDMLRRSLLENVQDLLPTASLVPASGSPRPPRDHVAPRSSVDFVRGSSSYGAAAAEPERLLAALPVRLEPGKPLRVAPDGPSILIVSLGVAWVGVILAGVAVAVLLWQAVSLSERRAAFVSAVTHELRTPLTTFRMYSEMLAGNMVTDEAKRHRYLDTLRIEANRLTHLVENVLSYARLERNKTRGRSEIVRMDTLVSRVEQRLSERAAQAGMQLATEMADSAGAASVRADVSAVEQILFNLIDNACKYAVTATDTRLHLVIDANGGGRVRLKVCDHGPGISAHDGRRLFRPFTKSARDAASSAPGVGLGLALSRRLAREMGGDLVLAPPTPDGACFILTLPVA
jgi:signal transduction histidine kinase